MHWALNSSFNLVSAVRMVATDLDGPSESAWGSSEEGTVQISRGRRIPKPTAPPTLERACLLGMALVLVISILSGTSQVWSW